MKTLWKAIGLLMVVAVLASCGPAATPPPVETEAPPPEAPTTAPAPTPTPVPPEPEVPQELVLNFRLGPTQLDPQMENSSSGQRALGNMFDKLVNTNPDFEVIPELAYDWDISDDGLTYTFYLEEGVTFHDGTPFNAEAVKFTFERLLDPDVGSRFAGDFDMIDSIEAIDDHSVQFTLKYPHGPFLRRLALSAAVILSPTAVEEWGEEFSSHAVGTGPFKLEEYVPNERVVLVRNEDYWREPAGLEKLTFTFISEEQSRVSALLAGDTDFEETIPPSMLPLVEADPNMVIERGPTVMPEWIGFNVERAPFDDVLVRKAVGYSLDMDTMLAEIFLGVGIRSTQPVAPPVFGFDDTIEPIPYDPDMARDLLAQAGWEDTDGDGVVDKDGEPFSVEFKLMPLTEIQRFGESIQGYMADVGMEANIVVLDWGAYLADLGTGNMQMFILGLANPLGDADMTLMTCFHSDQIGTSNYTRYNNPEMDRLIEEERRETDPERRLELLKEAINLAVDDVVYVPTFVRENLMAHHKKVKGFVLHPSDTFLNLETIYIGE